MPKHLMPTLLLALLTALLLGAVQEAKGQPRPAPKEEMAASEVIDPRGVWALEGRNPDGTPYRGRVQVKEQGNGYLVRWQTGPDQAFVGFGLRSGDSFAVAFTDDGRLQGMAIYGMENPDELGGIWSYLSRGDLGAEVWTRISGPDEDKSAPQGSRGG